MSYSLNVSGHKDTGSQEKSREFEEGVVAKAREFVAGLEGVTSASGTFGALGLVNLLSEDEG